jgi:hypothetical protein
LDNNFEIRKEKSEGGIHLLYPQPMKTPFKQFKSAVISPSDTTRELHLRRKLNYTPIVTTPKTTKKYQCPKVENTNLHGVKKFKVTRTSSIFIL